jgi:hypothetical protein
MSGLVPGGVPTGPARGVGSGRRLAGSRLRLRALAHDDPSTQLESRWSVVLGQEGHDCFDELLTVEQRGVVVVGPRDHHVARPVRRRGHSGALGRRNDRVGLPRDHQDRAIVGAEVINEREAVAQQQPYREERVVHLADVDEGRERRAQHECDRRPLGGKTDRDRGAEGFAEARDPSSIDVVTVRQPGDRRPRIARESPLGRLPGLPP